MAQGQMVKEQSKKRIFHFSATNDELCLPGNVGNVLLGQDENRENK